MDLRDLAVYVAAVETGKADTNEPVTGDERKRAYVSLYQSHLDHLAEADIIIKDGDHTIQPGPEIGTAVRALENVEEVTVTEPAAEVSRANTTDRATAAIGPIMSVASIALVGMAALYGAASVNAGLSRALHSGHIVDPATLVLLAGALMCAFVFGALGSVLTFARLSLEVGR